ncbi:L,D-transpeptidase family protein [Pyxidicoccus xibeiensis]|uniref:L,D-transpeptidase family protein n=1 Tax=Pyxidicoccus xibeiensis TaxID=2906759 RepID=UPI0020A6F9C1|nr:L,D-transpeptidase family protein [Pyxidicoccus xibeiensis]MCP3139120.1 L,D-transpeptidase family protein [Pyxidicoccus xibeiensis]
MDGGVGVQGPVALEARDGAAGAGGQGVAGASPAVHGALPGAMAAEAGGAGAPSATSGAPSEALLADAGTRVGEASPTAAGAVTPVEAADGGASASAASEALLAEWQRTGAATSTDGGVEPEPGPRPMQDLAEVAAFESAAALVVASALPGFDGSRAHAPALSSDPAMNVMPKPPPRDEAGEGAEPPPAEQLVVISDRKNPGVELVLGPDGEPLEDSTLVLDDIDPSLDPEDYEPGLEPASGADAGTELAPYAVPYAPDAGSLRVRRSIAVRQEPRRDAPPLGTVAQDMRVRWKGTTAMRGPDCDAWVEIEPRGWVCERYLEPNFREPRVRDLPKLREGELTPGIYARVVGKRVRAFPSLALARARRKGVLLKGSVTVQLRGQVRVGRRTFWRTTEGQYLEARVLREYRPSSFEGVDAEALAELSTPFAWAQSRTRPGADVEVRVAPDASAARETVLPPRTLVAVRELSADGNWVLIAEDHWVAREDLHVAWFTPAPPGVEPGDRWLDVDLDAQVLVAYEGERPVYATLISSGKAGTDTPEGLFRIWIKFAEADMTGNGTAGNDTYRVATVPWTMFFQDDYALHTAYWHDRFGEPMSHGCINLAPKDAKALYTWAAPEVPTGWSMVHATPDAPGSWVRIRGQARPPEKARKVVVAATRHGR